MAPVFLLTFSQSRCIVEWGAYDSETEQILSKITFEAMN